MEKVIGLFKSIVSFMSGYIDGISPIRAVVCSIMFLTLYAMYLYFVTAGNDSEDKPNTLTWIDGKIRAETSRISWNDIAAKQISRGVDFHTPKMMLPHYYIMIHVLIVAVGAGVLILIAPKLTPLCVLAVLIPTQYYKGKDKKDNSEITADVMSIASAMTVQIAGGEYLGSALCECKDIVRNKRLKAALVNFDRNIKLGNMTLIEAINDLGTKFTSPEILTLCIILRQGIETGKTVDCVSDLSRQCFSARESEFDSRKAHLDRLMTIAMLIVFADGIGFIMLRFFTNLMTAF